MVSLPLSNLSRSVPTFPNHRSREVSRGPGVGGRGGRRSEGCLVSPSLPCIGVSDELGKRRLPEGHHTRQHTKGSDKSCGGIYPFRFAKPSVSQLYWSTNLFLCIVLRNSGKSLSRPHMAYFLTLQLWGGGDQLDGHCLKGQRTLSDLLGGEGCGGGTGRPS